MQDTYIYNTLDKEVHVQAFGNHFHLRPGQVKRFNSDIGDFIAKEKGYLGVVAVSINFEDPSYKDSEAGQAELTAKREEGRRKRAQHLQGVVDNLNIGLRRDLDTANIKADVLSFASEGELSAMKELAGLQRSKEDEQKKRVEEARKVMRQLQANSDAQANRKD